MTDTNKDNLEFDGDFLYSLFCKIVKIPNRSEDFFKWLNAIHAAIHGTLSQ